MIPYLCNGDLHFGMTGDPACQCGQVKFNSFKADPPSPVPSSLRELLKDDGPLKLMFREAKDSDDWTHDLTQTANHLRTSIIKLIGDQWDARERRIAVLVAQVTQAKHDLRDEIGERMEAEAAREALRAKVEMLLDNVTAREPWVDQFANTAMNPICFWCGAARAEGHIQGCLYLEESAERSAMPPSEAPRPQTTHTSTLHVEGNFDVAPRAEGAVAVITNLDGGDGRG